MVANLADKAVAHKADTLVFLDKSARPLAWLLRQFWPDIAPQHEVGGSISTAPLPAIKFVRIDRIPWRLSPRQSFDEGGMRPITNSEVRGLRAIFEIGSSNVLDDRRILVIDEQSETGDTLRVATSLFERAFPHSTVFATAWITSVVLGGQREVRKIPAWYPLDRNWTPDEDQTGRGVFDPVPYDPRAPAHAPRFLPESYPFVCIPALGDERSAKLRREIKQLHDDFNAGLIWPRISTDRATIRDMAADDYGRRAVAVGRERG